jgi:antitoxin component YwqK of YwqJK toxin-antitoxin module
MNNNPEFYSRTTNLPDGNNIVSTYLTSNDDLIREEIYHNNIISQSDEYITKNGFFYKIQKKYYDNGNISEFSEFIRNSITGYNTRVGYHKKYFNNGNFQFLKIYNTSGYLHGTSIIYHPNGNILTSITYNNGNRS